MEIKVSISISDKEVTKKKLSDSELLDTENSSDNLEAFNTRLTAKIKDNISKFENII